MAAKGMSLDNERRERWMGEMGIDCLRARSSSFLRGMPRGFVHTAVEAFTVH